MNFLSIVDCQYIILKIFKARYDLHYWRCHKCLFGRKNKDVVVTEYEIEQIKGIWLHMGVAECNNVLGRK